MDLLLKQVRLEDGEPLVDIGIEAGRIVAIAPQIERPAAQWIEADGRVLIPGLVEAHLHLDKTLIADRMPNRSGTFPEALNITMCLKPTFTREDVRDRAQRTIRMLIKHGVTHLRAQAEFDPVSGFTGFEGVLEMKEKFRDLIDIQVVAFPQEGILKSPGTEEMMHEAVRMGADAIGGIPYNDTSAAEHIDLVFAIAQKYGLPLDFHADQKEQVEGSAIAYICKKTIAAGYQGRVSAGHLNSLSVFPPDRLEPTLQLMADAKIHFMCLPATDLHLGGRQDAYNVRRGMAPVRAMQKAGINVCLAANNIRNAFCPFGNGDPFMTAMLAITGAHLGGADDLSTVLPMLTTNAAKAIGANDYGLQEGKRADMVLLDTRKVSEAIIDMPDKLYVIKNGKVIVRSERHLELAF